MSSSLETQPLFLFDLIKIHVINHQNISPVYFYKVLTYRNSIFITLSPHSKMVAEISLHGGIAAVIFRHVPEIRHDTGHDQSQSNQYKQQNRE